jgi:hypothetical protein
MLGKCQQGGEGLRPTPSGRLPMRVNIRLSSIRRGLVPEGHLIVAHYEVVGRVFQKRPVPQAQGTIDWLLTLARPYASQG